MDHIKLFEDFVANTENKENLNEWIADILNKAKSGAATISLLASMLASPDDPAKIIRRYKSK